MRFSDPKKQKLYGEKRKEALRRFFEGIAPKINALYSGAPEEKRAGRMIAKIQPVFSDEDKKFFRDLKESSFPNNPREEAIYIDGFKEGYCREYYDNGGPAKEAFYKEGKLEGLCRRYYPNGQLEDQSVYVNDMRNGLCKFYHQEGWLEEESMFKNDRINGPSKLFCPNGQIKEESVFKDDVMLWKI